MFYLTFDIHPMAEFGFFFFVFFFLELICYFNPFLSILRVCLVTQSCPTLCDPWNPPGSSVHGIFQARTVEWVAISYTRRSSWTRESNPSLLLWWIDSLSLYHLGSPLKHPTIHYIRIKLLSSPVDLFTWIRVTWFYVAFAALGIKQN